MKIVLNISLLALLLVGAAQTHAQTVFDTLLQRSKMVFDFPQDFIPTEPIENRQMNWEASFRHPDKDFAVRYALRPLDNAMAEYEEHLRTQNQGDVFIHPNKWYLSLFQSTLLNISGGELPEIGPFPEAAVREEFNADWGGAAAVPCGPEFAHGYAYCLAICLHKDDVGDAYIFFMGNDMETISNEMNGIFHALRFQ